jgi:hypothetical protein
MSLAKDAFIKSVQVCRYGLCGYVAASYIKSMMVCELCAIQSSLNTAHIPSCT